MNNVMKFLVVAAALFSAFVFANTDLESRIKPVGELCMAGDECAKSSGVQLVASSGPRGGKDIYDAKCAMCHTTGAAGAPKFGDIDAWAIRLTKGNDTLYLNAINGINGMPAKGLCMDCSDEEIAAAVDHILDSSK